MGQKQKTEKKRKERPKVCNNNGQLRIATPPRVAHAKPPGLIFNLSVVHIDFTAGEWRSPMTRLGLSFRDQTLAVERRKTRHYLHPFKK